MRLVRFVVGLFCVFAFTSQAGFADPFVGSSSYKDLLAKVEVLTSEQKMQAAQDLLNTGYGSITAPTEQARLLIKSAQLETALHGSETAVQLMKSKTWPKDPQAFALLGLYHAKTLQNYVQMYSWEIRQREKTVSKNEKDLKTWTAVEIYGDAYRTLNSVWSIRDKLATISKNDVTDLIAPNNYPAGVRDTFRDSLTYLAVEMLNDSSGWSPAQSNDLNQLNLAELLNPSSAKDVDFSNEKIYPLQKVSAALEDLRLWNISKETWQGL